MTLLLIGCTKNCLRFVRRLVDESSREKNILLTLSAPTDSRRGTIMWQGRVRWYHYRDSECHLSARYDLLGFCKSYADGSSIDYREFKGIMRDVVRDVIPNPSEAAKYVDEHWSKYGQRFLNICINEKIGGPPLPSRYDAGFPSKLAILWIPVDNFLSLIALSVRRRLSLLRLALTQQSYMNDSTIKNPPVQKKNLRHVNSNSLKQWNSESSLVSLTCGYGYFRERHAQVVLWRYFSLHLNLNILLGGLN